MFLREISVVNYKNITSQSFNFEASINCFVGNNGVGKTNLLDAVYHLCMGKSYFNSSATQNIRHQEDFYLLQGLFLKQAREEHIVCSLKRGQKKAVKCNGKVYDKIADHVGKYPIVVVSPSDRDLIAEGSDIRRKFMDSVIGQSDAQYLYKLICYNQIINQRNALLKRFATEHFFDANTIEVYHMQMIALGEYIYKMRKQFMEHFAIVFQQQYQYITNGKEQVSLSYESALHKETFANLIQKNIEKDRMLQYSSVGVHKDDLAFSIDAYPIKKYGSQGQQKSFLIALKIAQFEMIKNKLGVTPILLLDDIFDKLDDLRVAKLISLVTQQHFGQIFITDTNTQRTEKVVKNTGLPYKLFEINN